MKSRVIKTGLAFMLTASMLLPNAPYGLTKTVKAAESKVVSGEIGDTNGDGIIDAIELVRLKKSQAGQDGYTDSKFDLNNDGKYDTKDMELMHKFLVNKITSFYRPDTSANNNDTSNYTVTDELDREMTVAGKKKNKTVGIRYFLHFGTGDNNQLYSVSNILATDSNAASSDAAWTAAGGGAVGTKHWWGEPLFGYYISTDAWVIDRDVQMLTDAGIDFIAVDTTDGFHETELIGLMNILSKYDKQGFVVPKVAFTDTTSIESELAAYKSAHAQFDGLWYETANVSSISKEVVKVADRNGNAMSAGAFYQSTDVDGRNYNGTTSVAGDDAYKNGYHFEFEFEAAIASGTDTILVDCWNEWLAERKTGTTSQAIILEENANAEYSSDIQPMKDGYGDDYYMQMVDYIKQFKGKFITNRNLNTASTTESVSVDVNDDFNQWNKVSTHYLDYTDDIADRNSDGYGSSNVEYVTNHMAAIKINRLNEQSPASFITKNAYAGGSTVSFSAYVPEGASWWKVCWTTDLSDTGLYGKPGQSMDSVFGQWANYSVTLPNDGNNYYVYLIGAKGEWTKNGTALELLVDDFKITSGDTVVTEKFDNGLSESIFSIAGNDVVNQKTVKEVKQNKVMAIDINQLADSGQMNVTTKKAYASGCTISFKACAPADTAWFAVGYTKDKTSGSLYDRLGHWSDGDGTWKDYSFTVPEVDGRGKVYLTLVGAKGEWKNKKLLIDDFKIETADGTVETDNFDSGLSDGLFDVIEISSGNGSTVVSSEVAETSVKEALYTDTTGRNDISKMKMTTDGINLYAYVETVDDIKGFGNPNCMSLFLSTGNTGGCYNQYEYVINRDSSKASDGKVEIEKYVGGAWSEVGTAPYRISGNRMQIAIPLTLLSLTDSFKIEFKWADNYTENDIYSFYTQGDVAPYGRLNYAYEVEGQVAAIRVNWLNDNTGKMNFITKKAYKGGSTVSFKAFIPEGAAWARFCWTPNKADGDLYGSAPGDHKTLDGKNGEWKEYTYTLPTSSDSYYLYFTGAKGEWPKDTSATPLEFLVDNFKVESEGKTYMDTFNSSLNSGLFDVIEKDSNNRIVVSLKETVAGTVDKAASLNLNSGIENGHMIFVTKDAYDAGCKVTIRAYIPSANYQWWGAACTTDINSGSIYDCTGSNKLLDEQKVGRWAEYTYNLPSDGGRYHIYIAGETGNWKEEILVDDVKIYNQNGELIAKDTFSDGFENGLFDINGRYVSCVDVEKGVSGNQAAAIKIANMQTQNAGAFMSRKRYPAGSTITFDAYVPKTSGWWRVKWTEDSSTVDMYSNTGLGMASLTGMWSNYTVTLPTEGGPYYFYIVGPEGDSTWKENGVPTTLLVDNMKVTNASGKVLVSDDFNHEFELGMMNVTDTNAISLVAVEEENNADSTIEIAAYSAPTINRKTKADDKDKLDAAYEKLAEAGFTKAIAMTEGYPGTTSGTPTAEVIQNRSKYTEEEAAVALDVAEKYNIKYLVKDWSFYGLGASKTSDESAYNSSQVSKDAQFQTVIENVFDAENTYVKHSAYAGNFAFDEPYLKDMDAIATQYKYFNQQQTKLGFGGEMFVNLYGSYISKNSAQLGTVWDQIFGSASGTYDGYVDTYLEKVGTNLGYICWDNYPFMTEGHADKAERDKNYLSNYELIANKCKNNGVELRTFVQSSGDDTGLRSLEGAEDIRYQMYSGLAFGTQEFVYYHYQGTSDSSNTNATSRDPKNFMYDYTSQTYTQVYDWAKEVNAEIHALENIYTQYKWVDIMYKKGDGTKEHTSLNNLSTSYKTGTYGNIEIDYCGQDTLTGIFTAKDGSASNAYMFVNVSVPTDNQESFVSVKFKDGAKGVAVWQGGKQTVLPISSNQYQFHLKPGEGAFVIPLK